MARRNSKGLRDKKAVRKSKKLNDKWAEKVMRELKKQEDDNGEG